MADPILDEDTIVALLKSPISAQTVVRIQSGAMQALMDLYDRKVTREEFVTLASPCVALHSSAARMWLLANVERVYDNDKLDDDAFKQANESLEALIRVQSETVIEIVKRLKMCSTSQDVVH